LWNIFFDEDGKLLSKINDESADKETLRTLHQMIKNISDNLDQLHFNTCVSEFMIFTNHLQSQNSINKDVLKTFVVCINPFMPHLAEELWASLGESTELSYEKWPSYNESMLESDIITIAVQVNGKRREEINISKDADEESVLNMAKSADKAAIFIEGKEIVKEIYVKGRIVNIVVR